MVKTHDETILVTGGGGFIGSNFLNLFVPRHPDIRFVNVDRLTYAANPLSLRAIEDRPNYYCERIDIRDVDAVREVFERHRPGGVIHLAAETHVDRSLHSPVDFARTNVMGTANLLEASRRVWNDSSVFRRFHHVSTDEVYGELGEDGKFSESTTYDPGSPYAASKAGSDHLVRAYHRSYGLPVVITNCSNNYGPRQHPEKLIPLMILNALSGRDLPVYGRGENVRDWLYVADHCDALWRVFTEGAEGETYNIGGNCEKTNLEVVRRICEVVGEEVGRPAEELRDRITFVEDRPGHDYRYAMDTAKISRHLGWCPRETFMSGLRRAVRWYIENPDWVECAQSGEYRRWVATNYDARGACEAPGMEGA
jgi:dTDP-glucose 4,6-dehydratase